jgi:glucosamine--fructose-6-phosphate aminotransferase (isomerizing)
MALIDEIQEQGHVLAALLETQSAQVEKIAGEIRALKPKYVFLAARGTSDNAGRYASYVWGSLNGLVVALATPSLFTLYEAPPRLDGALVVGISQSGQSPDIVSVLEEGRRQGAKGLVITNAPDSPLARAAEWVVDIQAGVEAAVAATKTYTAELLAIAMLAAAMQPEARRRAELSAALRRVPVWVSSVLAGQEQIARLAERYRYLERCVVLGRGYNYATAFEWSLKLKELTYVTAEPYSSADFQHGPIAIIESGFPVLVVAPSGRVFDNFLPLLQKLRRQHKAELVVISDRAEALAEAQTPLPLPVGIPEWLSPIPAIVPAQLFACCLTRVKGFDTEAPRSIQKVTETE